MKSKITLFLILCLSFFIKAGAQNNEDTPMWTGTGFAISDMYVVTNYHVVDGAKILKITGVNGEFNTSYTVSVVAVDKNNDLAILKILDSKFLGFSNIPYSIYSSNADVGTEIFVLGYPSTVILGQEVKITTGIINSRSGFQGDISTYQMSATIQSGNSGGPVFDNDGNIVAVAVGGINRELLQNIENVNYSVKSPYLINLIESCSEYIAIPSTNRLKGLSLSAKVKEISQFVVQIIAYDETLNSPSLDILPLSTADKERSDMFFVRALKSLENGDLASSYEELKIAVKLYPDAEKHFNLACAGSYFAIDTINNKHFKEDIEIAISSFKYCINAKYEVKNSMYQLARIYKKMGRNEESMVLCDKLLINDSRDVSAYSLRAKCKEAMGNIDGALHDYLDASNLEGLVKGDYGEIYRNIACIYLEKDNYILAETYIKEALKRNALKGCIWSTDGAIAYLKGEYERCIASINNAIIIDGNDTALLYIRGLSKSKLGDLHGAYRDFEEAKTLGKNVLEEILKIDTPQTRKERFHKVITRPKTHGINEYDVFVKSIILDETYTAIVMQMHPWRCVNRKINIKLNGNGDSIPLIHTQNCNICHEENTINANNELEKVLYFPAIDSNVSKITLTEVDDDGNIGWNFNIRLKEGTMQSTEKSNTRHTTFALRGILGFYDEYETYTKTYGIIGARVDFVHGKHIGIGLSVPLYYLPDYGCFESGLSVIFLLEVMSMNVGFISDKFTLEFGFEFEKIRTTMEFISGYSGWGLSFGLGYKF